MREALNPLGIQTLALAHGFTNFIEHPPDFWREVFRTRYLAFCQSTMTAEHILKH